MEGYFTATGHPYFPSHFKKPREDVHHLLCDVHNGDTAIRESDG